MRSKVFLFTNILILLSLSTGFAQLDPGFPIGFYNGFYPFLDEIQDLNGNFTETSCEFVDIDDNSTKTSLSSILGWAEARKLKVFAHKWLDGSNNLFSFDNKLSVGWDGDHDNSKHYADIIEAEGGYSETSYGNLMGDWYEYSWSYGSGITTRDLSSCSAGNHNGTAVLVPTSTSVGTNILSSFVYANPFVWLYDSSSTTYTLKRAVFISHRCADFYNNARHKVIVTHIDANGADTADTLSWMTNGQQTGASSNDDFLDQYAGTFEFTGFDYSADSIKIEVVLGMSLENEIEIDKIILANSNYMYLDKYAVASAPDWSTYRTHASSYVYPADGGGSQTLYGIYVNEVTPGAVDAVKWVNDAFNVSGEDVVGVQSSISKDYINSTYWFLRNNTLGASDQNPFAAWGHLYPFYVGDPDSGSSGYESKIEYRLDNLIIPHWKKLYAIGNDADKPMWAGIAAYTADHHSFRKVIPSEIRLQANIAIACGAKGIWYYPIYDENEAGNGYVGLVDDDGNHSASQFAYNYNAVKAYNAVLEQWSDDLLRTTWDETWKCDGTGNPIDNDLISSVSSLDGEVQFTIFDTDVSTVKYLLVVNRYTHDDASVTFSLNSSNYQRTVVDCGTNQLIDLVASGSPSVTLSNIEAGGAVLLRITTLSSSTAGSVSGEWWYDRKIGGDITVSSGNTLTLLPSVCLVFQSYTDSQSSGMDTGKSELIVEGTLQSDGNTFISTTEQANTWHSIRFNGTSSSGYIKNSVVKWAYRAIMINNCSPTIQGNDLDHNQYGIWAYGQYNHATINFNDVSNSGLPMVISSTGNPTLSNNKFSGSDKVIYIASDGRPDHIQNCDLLGYPTGANYQLFITGANSRVNGGWEGADYGNYISDDVDGDVIQIDGGQNSYLLWNNSNYEGIGSATYFVDNNDGDTFYAKNSYWGSANPSSTRFDGNVDYTGYKSSPLTGPGASWKRAAEQSTIYDQGLALLGQRKYSEAATVLFDLLRDNIGADGTDKALSSLVVASWYVDDSSLYLTYFNQLANSDLPENLRQIARGALVKHFSEAGDLETAEKYVMMPKRSSLYSRELLIDFVYRCAVNEDSDRLTKILEMLRSDFAGDDIEESIRGALQLVPDEILLRKEARKLGKRASNKAIVADNFDVFAAYPNPFNPSTTIRYAIEQPSDVTIAVFNVMGQRVRTLVNRHEGAGAYEVTWDGRDEYGAMASTGIYFIQMTTPSLTKNLKVLLTK